MLITAVVVAATLLALLGVGGAAVAVVVYRNREVQPVREKLPTDLLHELSAKVAAHEITLIGLQDEWQEMVNRAKQHADRADAKVRRLEKLQRDADNDDGEGSDADLQQLNAFGSGAEGLSALSEDMGVSPEEDLKARSFRALGIA